MPDVIWSWGHGTLAPRPLCWACRQKCHLEGLYVRTRKINACFWMENKRYPLYYKVHCKLLLLCDFFFFCNSVIYKHRVTPPPAYLIPSIFCHIIQWIKSKTNYQNFIRWRYTEDLFLQSLKDKVVRVIGVEVRTWVVFFFLSLFFLSLISGFLKPLCVCVEYITFS